VTRLGRPVEAPSGDAPASPPVQIGEILAGKYRVERLLGVGAMGVVVAAMHVDLHEIRAIKLMLPSMLGDVEGVERFLREARAVSKLRSRHVATVFDVGRLASGAPYIVMEHLEGSDLKSVLSERGVLSPGEAATFVSEACEALSEAHAAGIIHRDIKPANLFVVTRRGAPPSIKLLDFGIAKMASGPGGQAAMEITKTQEILGTPLYMAPEQMRSMRNADARSDVWSLGVILYRALTGRLPFEGETLTEVCVAVLSDTPPRPSTLRPDLPRGLEAVILGCLEKDPSKRIAGAAELATALAPFVIPTVRAPLQSFAAEQSIVTFGPPPPIPPPPQSAPRLTAPAESTNTTTRVWKPSAVESRDQTTSQASWAQTGKGAARSSRIGIRLAVAGALLTLTLIAAIRLLTRHGTEPAPASDLAIAPTSEPVPTATLAAPEPTTTPVINVPVAPVAAAPPAIVAPAPTVQARASTPAPRPSASAKAPARNHGEAFVGRY
jgi:serine/threonine-protein kinase